MFTSIRRDHLHQVLHTLAHLSLLFLHSAEGSVREALLEKYSCTTPSALTNSSLIFTSVTTNTECGVKCVDSCVAVVIKEDSSSGVGGKQCAVLSSLQQIPSHSKAACAITGNSVVVYKNSLVQTSSLCNATISVFGRELCLHTKGDSTNSYTQAVHVCEHMGGQLPEALTGNHTAAITALFPDPSFIWMAATDEVTHGTYLWPHGVAVSPALWDSGEPDNLGFERCTSLAKYLNNLLINLPCEGFAHQVNIVCAIIFD
ncbi:uncharacterized protein LOC101846962 [Aplysia californica]|uniref:Uncharacterized protein LOC101846962 n=1 Tax=Aplysia californica TaxID=6500 RepID=A0ABM0ZZV4_APLCA|nr:uncharacterized protein LOC101846962 [Aplysia californica]